MIHKTVETYLDRGEWLQDFGQCMQNGLVHGQELWVSTCANYSSKIFQLLRGGHHGMVPGVEDMAEEPLAEVAESLGEMGCLLFYAKEHFRQHAKNMEVQTNRSSFPILSAILSDKMIFSLRMRDHYEHLKLCVEAMEDRGTEPTALSIAAYGGMRMFCQDKIDAGTGVNERNGRALMAAIVAGHEEIIALMLQHNALVDDRHLLFALSNCYWKVVEQLLNERTDTLGGSLRLKDRNGEPIGPLYAAAQRGIFISDARNIIGGLLARGEQINAVAGPLGTALHAAVASFTYPALKCLLEKGADANAQGPHGKPLEVVEPLGAGEVLNTLISFGADLNDPRPFHRTPLQNMVQGRDAEAAKTLLEHGADLNADPNHLGTPLQLLLRQPLVKFEKDILLKVLNGVDDVEFSPQHTRGALSFCLATVNAADEPFQPATRRSIWTLAEVLGILEVLLMYGASFEEALNLIKEAPLIERRD